MTLSSDINTTSSSFNDIKNAIINKGGSASGSITTYPNAINNIKNKIILNREVSAQGVYQVPTTSFTFSLPSNATGVGTYALYYAFYNCSSLTSVDLSGITAIDIYGLHSAFSGCSNLTSINLSSLLTVNSQSFYSTCMGCRNLTSIDLSNLTSIIGNSVFTSAFYNCRKLTSVNFNNLTSIIGSSIFFNAFQGCNSLQTLSFPSLNSNSFGTYKNQFDSMLYGVADCVVYFPRNLQSVIGSWASVTNGFGGTDTTVLFNLPATT